MIAAGSAADDAAAPAALSRRASPFRARRPDRVRRSGRGVDWIEAADNYVSAARAEREYLVARDAVGRSRRSSIPGASCGSIARRSCADRSRREAASGHARRLRGAAARRHAADAQPHVARSPRSGDRNAGAWRALAPLCPTLDGGGSGVDPLVRPVRDGVDRAASARPFFVSAYSTRTGVSGTTVRSMIPSSSSSCSRSLSMRSVMSGIASRKVANRQRDLSSTKMIAPVHRRPISSLARWKRVQSAGVCAAVSFVVRLQEYPAADDLQVTS